MTSFGNGSVLTSSYPENMVHFFSLEMWFSTSLQHSIQSWFETFLVRALWDNNKRTIKAIGCLNYLINADIAERRPHESGVPRREIQHTKTHYGFLQSGSALLQNISSDMDATSVINT